MRLQAVQRFGQIRPAEAEPEVVATEPEVRARQQQDTLGLDEVGGPVVDGDALAR